MLRSLFSAISGLRANQTMIDVTGNNVANANTVGFKSSNVLFQDTLFGQWIVNTLQVGLIVTAITLLLAVPAGYALARLAGRWGHVLAIGIFLTYLIPPTILFIPFSRIVGALGLQDSLWSLVLVYPSFTVPFCTWLMMGFFKSIPRDIEEAAMIDGLSRFGAFVRANLLLFFSLFAVMMFMFLLLAVGLMG